MNNLYISAILSTIHMLGLGLAFLGLFQRIRACYEMRTKRIFAADNIWGISAILLVGSGLMRAFLPYEKGSAFYLQNFSFYMKMGFFLIIFVLEIFPMIILIRWRIITIKGKPLETKHLNRYIPVIRNISFLQAILLIGLILSASLMARGIWMIQN